MVRQFFHSITPGWTNIYGLSIPENVLYMIWGEIFFRSLNNDQKNPIINGS